jgi:Ni,Fe-hydrogenase I small subunit
MYYEGNTDEPEEAEDHGGSDATHCWCLWTQGCRGPDQEIVGIRECGRPERKCFVGIQSLA